MSIATIDDRRIFLPMPRPRPSRKLLATMVSILLHAAAGLALVSLADRIGDGPGPSIDAVVVELVAPETAVDAPAVPATPPVAETERQPVEDPKTAEAEASPAPTDPPEPPIEVARAEPPSAEPVAEPPPEAAPTPPEPPIEVARAEIPPTEAVPIETPVAEPPPVVERKIDPPPAPPRREAVEPHRPAKKPPAEARPAPKTKTAAAAKPAAEPRNAPGTPAIAGRAQASGGDRDALASYLASVRARITGQRRNHIGSERGRVEVRFTVDADGRLGGLQVGGAADGTLEDEALKVVRRASPVAPIPAAVGRTSLAMSVTLVFE
jgi:TonB family protein